MSEEDIRAALAEAITLVQRLAHQLEEGVLWIEELGVIEPRDLSALSGDQAIKVESFLKRFENAVEAVQRPLFRTLLSALNEDVNAMSARDRVLRLETLNYLPGGVDWLGVLNTRNTIVHEYSLSSDERGVAVIAAAKAARDTIATIYSVVEKARSAGLMDEINPQSSSKDDADD